MELGPDMDSSIIEESVPKILFPKTNPNEVIGGVLPQPPVAAILRVPNGKLSWAWPKIFSVDNTTIYE